MFLVARGCRISARVCPCCECIRSKVPNPRSLPVPVTFIEIVRIFPTPTYIRSTCIKEIRMIHLRRNLSWVKNFNRERHRLPLFSEVYNLFLYWLTCDVQRDVRRRLTFYSSLRLLVKLYYLVQAFSSTLLREGTSPAKDKDFEYNWLLPFRYDL